MGTTTATGTWLRRFHPADDAAVRMVCFPHSGGSAAYFFPVSRGLSPDVDVLTVQYPGRAERRAEPCVTDVRAMADLVVDELLPWCDRPLALFGHSLGGMVAFEVALRLQELGTPPVALFASGRRAPSAQRDEPYMHLAAEDHLMEVVLDLGGTGGTVRSPAAEQLLRLALPALRGDLQAAETYRYRPGPLLTCPVTVLNGDADSRVTLREATAWRRHTAAATTFRWFPGGHFYLDSHRPALLDLLRAELLPAR